MEDEKERGMGGGFVSSLGLRPQGLETQRGLHPKRGGDEEGGGGIKNRPVP